MSGRERVEKVRDPRDAALDFVTSGGKHTLQVTQFLDAGPPSGERPEKSYVTGIAAQNSASYANAKTGIQGRVVETGQSFTVRDDYDFLNPGAAGKGYHVNAQLGRETAAFCQDGLNTEQMYYDRTNMTGERVCFDGEAAAAEWYAKGRTGK